MSPRDHRVTCAVVTGGHSYQVPAFHRLFRSVETVDATIQHMDDFASSPEEVRDGYDVVLFYIMLTEGPRDEGLPWYGGRPRTTLEHLGATRQGVVVLHHALLAYPEWPVWDEIVGIGERAFGYHIGETLEIDIADGEHPITRGLIPWTMVDETYTMQDAGAGSDILLTVDHPRSMRTIAWTRTYRNSPVFCLQSGHDDETWSNANFRQVLERGILWAAGASAR
jgi:hypothetical protein